MTPRARRPWVPLLVGMVVAVVIAAAALTLLTRTESGREQILAYTLRTLGGQLNGELDVGRLEGSLFTGARLHRIVLRDPQGRVLLSADSAYLNYELPTFFGGDVVLNRVVLYHPDLFLYKLPGDTLWNYQRVLQRPEPPQPQEAGRATIIDRMRLIDAEVVVRAAWEPDDELPEEEREEEIRVALADTSRLLVDRVPGGLVRTMYFRVDDGVIDDLAIAPDERGGTYLQVERMNGLAQLYLGQPLRVRGLQGELSLRDGVLRFDAPTVLLPDSRLAAAGTVDLRPEEPIYDLKVVGDRVALDDLQWLYPPLPEAGSAEFVLWLETHPEGFFYRVRDLLFVTPDTRLVGRFGLLAGYETLRFTDVALEAEPLGVETIEAIFPTEIPVRGLEIGGVTIRSPAS